MPILWVRYAVLVEPDHLGNDQVTFSAEKPAADVAGPVWELTMAGPEGGAVEIPEGTRRLWEMYQYRQLPLYYQGTVERIR
jgi:hypothetical protein